MPTREQVFGTNNLDLNDSFCEFTSTETFVGGHLYTGNHIYI